MTTVDASKAVFRIENLTINFPAKRQSVPSPLQGLNLTIQENKITTILGQSGCGKSTLLNALTNRNGLARTSNTPGRTQELNFFDVGDPLRFRLVDMPGYGYAKAPKDMVKKWRFLVNDYLRGRAVLKRTLVLIDSRHGIKDVDVDMLDMLDGAAVSYRIVLTKADKIKASELAKVTALTADAIRKRPAMSIC